MNGMFIVTEYDGWSFNGHKVISTKYYQKYACAYKYALKLSDRSNGMNEVEIENIADGTAVSIHA